MTTYYSAGHVTATRTRGVHLWIPLLLVWILLLPFVLLLAPVVFIACLIATVNPLRGVAFYWQVFNSLRGLRVEVEDPRAQVRIRIT